MEARLLLEAAVRLGALWIRERALPSVLPTCAALVLIFDLQRGIHHPELRAPIALARRTSAMLTDLLTLVRTVFVRLV